MSATHVTFNEDESRYDLHVDGELAGFAEVRLSGPRSVFTHTEVFEKFRGGGHANALAEGALKDATDKGRTIVPLCPFIGRYLKRNEIPGAQVDWPEPA